MRFLATFTEMILPMLETPLAQSLELQAFCVDE
jgi:hypothetical protein